MNNIHPILYQEPIMLILKLSFNYLTIRRHIPLNILLKNLIRLVISIKSAIIKIEKNILTY